MNIVRLAHEDINWIVKTLFKNQDIDYLMKDEFIKHLKESKEILLVFNKLHKSMQESLIYARDQALINMKNMLEIKKVVLEMMVTLEKQQLAIKKK